MKKLLLSLAVLLSSSAFAQVFEVTSVDKLNISASNATVLAGISPKGDYVLLTGEMLEGLVKYDLATGNTEVVTEALGAGNDVKFTEDGKSFAYREDSFENGLRKTTVVKHNISNGEKTTLVKDARNVSAVSLQGKKALVVKNGAIAKLQKTKTASATTVSIDNRQLMITRGGKTSVLSPNGTQFSYIWPSLSPDGSKVCYFVCGVGCFVCNIDGSDVRELGILRAAQWYDNNTVVGMRDTDDGHVITASNIIAKTLDGTEQVLTDDSMIALYPYASGDAQKIAFSTAEGETYIINVK